MQATWRSASLNQVPAPALHSSVHVLKPLGSCTARSVSAGCSSTRFTTPTLASSSAAQTSLPIANQRCLAPVGRGSCRTRCPTRSLPSPQRQRSTDGVQLARPPAALPEWLESLAVSPYRDLYAVTFAAIGAVIWVKVFDLLAANGTLEQKLSRKLVHTTTGPLFVLSWILFSAAPTARFLAVVTPMLNFARLVSVGTGLWSDPGLVKSVSRSGDRTELLKGPLYYVVTLVAATVLCWRDNPAGLIAVSMMCGGDGLADIVGRRFGGAKLPFNKAKSWAGSVAMLVGGYGMSYGLITLFCGLGFFSCYPQFAMLSCLGAVALAATIAESLPVNQYLDDNLSVPLVAGGLALLLLPPQPAEAIVSAAVVATGVPVTTGLAVTAATATAAVAAAAAAPVGLML